MKYIESEVMISAMLLGMLKNNQDSITDTEAEIFGMQYITKLKENYFPDEPLISDHISHETLVKFWETYPEALSYSFLKQELTIKYLPPETEAFFREKLFANLVGWLRKVGLERWKEEQRLLFSSV